MNAHHYPRSESIVYIIQTADACVFWEWKLILVIACDPVGLALAWKVYGKPKCITIIHNHFPFMSFSCPFHVFAWAFHVIFRVTCSRSATCFFGAAWCSIIQHDSARTQKPALTSAKLKERQISSSKTDKSRCLMKSVRSVRSVRSVLNPDKSKGDSHGYTVRL